MQAEIRSEIGRLEDAIVGTSAYIERLGVSSDVQEKICVLMRMSFELGKITHLAESCMNEGEEK